MTYFPAPPNNQIRYDAGDRARVSSLTTLFDGKTLNADETALWDQKGTGTGTFANSAVSMAVTAGQYLIRQSFVYSPYFSGKTQLVEMTFDNFANDANVVKRVGYFTSNAVAPYASTYDGVWLEATGTSYKLCVANTGTLTLNLDWTQWDGYDQLSSYDWDSFTVVLFDFLWLGGAVLRMFVKTSTGFVLAHTFNYAGSGVTGVFMRSPQKPVRYEIRSTTGAGSVTAICCQVSSEGSLSEQYKSLAVYNTTVVPCAVVGTIYALKGMRAVAAYRDQTTAVIKFGGAVISNVLDGGIFMILRNPVLSAPLTWAANGRIEEGTGSGAQTVTNPTLVVDTLPVVNSGESSPLERNIFTQLPVGIDNTMGELILAYQPYTATQDVTGTMTAIRN